jgi:hypothetical protein
MERAMIISNIVSFVAMMIPSIVLVLAAIVSILAL